MMFLKPIPCATYRLAKIAQPRKLNVCHTYLGYADILSPKHIENLRSYLDQDLRFTRLDQVVEYYAQSKCNAKMLRSQRRHEIRKIRRRIKKLKRKSLGRHLQNVLNRIFQNMYPFLLANNVHALNERRLELSDVILRLICNWIGYTLPPNRSSKAFYDTFIVNLADNIAIWLDTFVINSGYEGVGVGSNLLAKYDVIGGAESSEEDDEKAVFPIQDYIEYSTDDISSAGCSTDGMDEECAEEGEIENEDVSVQDSEASKLPFYT